MTIFTKIKSGFKNGKEVAILKSIEDIYFIYYNGSPIENTDCLEEAINLFDLTKNGLKHYEKLEEKDEEK